MARQEDVEKALHGVMENALSLYRKRCSSDSDDEEEELRPLHKTRYIRYQLICFHLCQIRIRVSDIVFNSVVLHHSNKVTHLEHILSSDLNDKSDIIRAVKDLNHKANSLFHIFHVVDQFVKCLLFLLFIFVWLLSLVPLIIIS